VTGHERLVVVSVGSKPPRARSRSSVRSVRMVSRSSVSFVCFGCGFMTVFITRLADQEILADDQFPRPVGGRAVLVAPWRRTLTADPRKVIPAGNAAAVVVGQDHYRKSMLFIYSLSSEIEKQACFYKYSI